MSKARARENEAVIRFARDATSAVRRGGVLPCITFASKSHYLKILNTEKGGGSRIHKLADVIRVSPTETDGGGK